MKTVLTAPVEVFAISALTEVAVWERRPELQRLFVASSAGGKVDATVIAAALPGLSGSACTNVLRHIEHLKLIEANGTITPFGKRCGETGDAPAWELGVFTFLVAKHPCFAFWPIAFRRERADGQDRDFTSLKEVPDWFTADPKQIWTSGFDGTVKFTISSFPVSAGGSAWCRVETGPAALLVWELELGTGKNRLHLEEGVSDEQGPTRFRTSEQTAPVAEVARFFANWEPRWSAAEGRVLLPYDGSADKGGHDTFTRTLTYPQVTCGNRGSFKSAKVEEVPVGPSGTLEAREWAMSLALARIDAADSFVPATTWARQWQESIVDTPLQDQAGAAPALVTLLDQRTSISPRLRWLLAAGADLGME